MKKYHSVTKKVNSIKNNCPSCLGVASNEAVPNLNKPLWSFYVVKPPMDISSPPLPLQQFFICILYVYIVIRFNSLFNIAEKKVLKIFVFL